MIDLPSVFIWNWWTGNGDWWGAAKAIAIVSAVVVVIRLLSEIANLLATIHEILLRTTGGLPPPGVIVDEYLEKHRKD
jgi:hypothetical protein